MRLQLLFVNVDLSGYGGLRSRRVALVGGGVKRVFGGPDRSECPQLGQRQHQQGTAK